MVYVDNRYLIVDELDPGQKYKFSISVKLEFDPKLVFFLPGLYSMIFAVVSQEFVQLYLLEPGECKPIQRIEVRGVVCMDFFNDQDLFLALESGGILLCDISKPPEKRHKASYIP